jgi:hypothetical protein
MKENAKMDKQSRLNDFITDLAQFFEMYYSSQIEEISKEKKGDWIIQKIVGPNNSIIEIWTDGPEITISFGESHWHIDDYNDPCDYENIYENTIDSILSILRGDLCTASYWLDGREKGGETITVEDLEKELREEKIPFGKFNEIRIKKWAEETEIIKR